MHLARDWSFGDSLSLAMARLAGRYIPLAELEGPFPSEENAMHLAYQQSRSLVSYILKERYSKASIGVLVDDLTDPDTGGELVAVFWNRLIRDGIELSWRQSTKRVSRNILLIATSNTFLLFAITLFAFYAFYKKRKRQRILMEEWVKEEEIYSSLADEDSWYADDGE
jgi:hypothetical protein